MAPTLPTRSRMEAIVVFCLTAGLVATAQASPSTFPALPAPKPPRQQQAGLDTDVRVSGNTITARFNDLPPVLANNNPLLDLHAVAGADKVQSQKPGGVNLTVTITNTGHQAITLANPLDFMSVFLRNKNGWPVELPPSYSRFLFDGPRKATDANGFHLSFEVKQVTLNNHKVTQKEVEQHSYLLAPKAVLQMTMRIDNIVTSTKLVPVQNSANGTASSEPIKTLGNIPPGEYQVKLQLLLVGPANKEMNRTLETGILHIELT